MHDTTQEIISDTIDVQPAGELQAVRSGINLQRNTERQFKNKAAHSLFNPKLAIAQTTENYLGYQDRCQAMDQAAIIAETDLSGTIIYVNEKFCEISGFSQQELLGTNHRILNSGSHSADFFQDLWATIIRGVVWQGEICNRAKEGHLYWVNTTIVPMFDEQTRRLYKFIAIRFDITHRKLMEQALAEKEEAARRIFDGTSHPVLLLKDGYFVDCNAAALNSLGFSCKSDLLNLAAVDISPVYQPDGRLSNEKIAEMNAIAIREGHHCYEWVHLHTDGSCFEVEITLTLIHLNNEGILHKQWRNITEHKQLELALYTEKERAEVTLASIGDAVITTDKHGIVTFLNPVAIALTGWVGADAVGKPIADVFHIVNEVTRQKINNPVDDVLQYGKIETLASDTLLISRDGTEYNIEDSAAPIYLKEGALLGCVLVFHNVTEKHQLMKDAHWQAGHDVLTRLPNRALLADRFARALVHAQRQQKLLSVCMMDLDDFKPINDLYGHAVGDQLLVAVTSRMSTVIRGEDTLARLGGDEFALLIGNLSDVEEMNVFLLRLLASVSAPYLIEGKSIKISASIGMTIYPRDNVDADTLLRHADQAMYQAKQSGRNCFHLFDVEHDQLTQNFHQTRERVRQALLGNELCLYYQPKVNMRSCQVVGMEALLRWQHPEHGLVPPLDFLPLVEQSDLIIDIGEWVIAQALGQISAWVDAGNLWVVSVNIAARHFQHPEFLTRLTDILARHPDVPPQLLEIEILESVALGDLEYVHQLINACQALGVTFSLDDFGTGYSSLSYLKRLPADTLKVDQSFVRDMLDNKEDLALIEAVIGLASVFNRKVIAEGVETAEHGVLLMRLGCDLAQGFGIGRPMPPSRVLAWVKQFTPDPSWALWADVQWELNNFPLLVAQYDHLKWLKQLANAVEGKPSFLADVAYKDHNHCRFGQWYAGYGKLNYYHLPEFLVVASLHLEMHVLGSIIIDLCTEGDLDLARELNLSLIRLSEKIMAQFAVLQLTVANVGLESACPS
ncbi:MAG: EAL domain-containing protein [Methylococcaceae bacterium]